MALGYNNTRIPTLQFGHGQYAQDGEIVNAQYWQASTAGRGGIAFDAFNDNANTCPYNLLVYTDNTSKPLWSTLEQWTAASGNEFQTSSGDM